MVLCSFCFNLKFIFVSIVKKLNSAALAADYINKFSSKKEKKSREKKRSCSLDL